MLLDRYVRFNQLFLITNGKDTPQRYQYEGFSSNLYSVVLHEEFLITNYDFEQWKRCVEGRSFKQCIKYKEAETYCMNIPHIHISNTNPMDHVNENPDKYRGLETRLEIIEVDPVNNPDDVVDWDNFKYYYDDALTKKIPLTLDKSKISPVDSDLEADQSISESAFGEITPPASVQSDTTLLLKSVADRLENKIYCLTPCENQSAHNCRIPPPSSDIGGQTPAKRLKSNNETSNVLQTVSVTPVVAKPNSEQRMTKFYNQMLLKRFLSLNDDFVTDIFDKEVFPAFVNSSYVLDLVSDVYAEVEAEILFEKYYSEPPTTFNQTHEFCKDVLEEIVNSTCYEFNNLN